MSPAPAESQEADALERRYAYGAIHLALTGFIALVTGAGGGIGMGSTLRGQDQTELKALTVATAQLSETVKVMQYQLSDLIKKQERVAAMSEDRWTATKHEAWAAQHVTQERAQVSELSARLADLATSLRDHVREPWHTQAGAEHGETKRRVDRIDARLDKIESARSK